MKIDQGERVDIVFEDADADSVMFLVSADVNTPAFIEKTALFVAGEAQITLLNADTDIAPGNFIYQVRVYTGTEYFIPTLNNCDDKTIDELIIEASIQQASS